MGSPEYFARLCWNSSGWVHPTGEAARAERETYAAQHGFGHEEWLFNYQWVLDGWKYGFLQPINRSLAKVQGETIDVRLYTIDPDSSWFHVGQIRSCEVLTEEQASAARKAFKQRGWFKQMTSQLRQIGGDGAELNYDRATLTFNIRFRERDATLYDPMVPVAPKDGLRTLRRYTLTAVAGARKKIAKDWATRVASTELRPTGKKTKAGAPKHEVDLAQNQLQNELFSLLTRRYGKGAVKMEEGYVDIKVRRPKASTLIEIKSDSRPRHAIRQALGQLLEYAFVAEEAGESVGDLVVVAPGTLDPKVATYVEHLRKHWRLPIRYVCFRSGMSEVDI